MKLTTEQRFAAKTRRKGECLEWIGSRNSSGYGMFYYGGQTRKAHRVAYEMAHGSIADGMQICHRCDNPWCVEPSHLFMGSASDNMRDALSKGRLVTPITSAQRHFHAGHAPRGERASGARLTRAQAQEIVLAAAGGELTKTLASRYGVARSTIQGVLRGSTWADIRRPPGLFPRPSSVYRRPAGREALKEQP
jgi:hypothetical protein